jgi:hypothetical protein
VYTYECISKGMGGAEFPKTPLFANLPHYVLFVMLRPFYCTTETIQVTEGRMRHRLRSPSRKRTLPTTYLGLLYPRNKHLSVVTQRSAAARKQVLFSIHFGYYFKSRSK